MRARDLRASGNEASLNEENVRSLRRRGIFSSMSDLEQELAALSPALRASLEARGFSKDLWIELGASLRSGDPATRRKSRNQIRGEVRAPEAADLVEVQSLPNRDALKARGEEILRRGEVAFAVMAGGMATRMGGVVKSLVEVAGGLDFLGCRLRESVVQEERYGKAIPLWLMTSLPSHEATTDALKKRGVPPSVQTFEQGVGLRFSMDGGLFRDPNTHEPSLYATGHGDLVDALRRSGLLQAFRKAGGKYVWIANVDNLGANVDPTLLGWFAGEQERGKKAMVEVCEKHDGDKGGIPVYADGALQVLEEFRLPETFRAETVRVFNTNTFLVDAEALENVDVKWNWFEVEKSVGTQKTIQFERLLQEITAFLPTTYAKVSRAPGTSRFLPVKDNEELLRRKDEITDVLRGRGVV